MVKSRSNSRNTKRQRRTRRSRGGALSFPSEYFGVSSGKYVADANAGRCPNAYGYTVAQSMGNDLPGNQVGPNMHAHPNASGTQTGGGVVMPA